MSVKAALSSLILVGVLIWVSCRPKPQGQMTEEEEFLKAGIDLTRENPGLAIFSLTRAIKLNPKLAAAYKQRAIALTQVRNYDVAEADVKIAIALEGESSAILRLRAEIERQRGQSDAAIATLTHVIEIDPKNAFNHSLRAELREGNGDLEGASMDYTWALELDSIKINLPIYHDRRGFIREKLGDLDGALADYTAAIGHLSHNTFYRGEPNFRRGSILYGRRAFKEALDDFRAAAANCRDRMNFVSRLHAWLARSRLGEREQADKELAAFLANEKTAQFMDADDQKFVSFLLGKISEADFLEHNKTRRGADTDLDSPRDLLVWYYAGMKRLLDGDLPAATEFLRKAAAIEPKDYPSEECHWARSELKLLSRQRSKH